MLGSATADASARVTTIIEGGGAQLPHSVDNSQLARRTHRLERYKPSSPLKQVGDASGSQWDAVIVRQAGGHDSRGAGPLDCYFIIIDVGVGPSVP